MIDNTANYIREAERTYGQRVQAAGFFLQGEIRKLISTPSRTVTREGGKKILGRRGGNRSKPGEPPHMDHGRLRQNIAQDFSQVDLRTRVGSNVSYARSLELGTKKMAPRPFLRRSLADHRQRIVSMITGK